MRGGRLLSCLMLSAVAGCYASHRLDRATPGPADAGLRDVRTPPDVPRTWTRCRVDESPRPGFADPAPRARYGDRSVLTEGSVGAELRLADVVIATNAAAGDYTLLADGTTITARLSGTSRATTGYDASVIVYAGATAGPAGTFLLPGLGTFGVVADAPGATSAPLSELPSLFDGVRPLHVDPPAVLREGLDDSVHHFASITLAPSVVPGDYTFVATRARYGEPSSIVATRDGFEVGTATYFWEETLGLGHDSTIDFPGLFAFEIGLSLSGTANMYGLEDAYFDGRDVLRVVCE